MKYKRIYEVIKREENYNIINILERACDMTYKLNKWVDRLNCFPIARPIPFRISLLERATTNLAQRCSHGRVCR